MEEQVRFFLTHSFSMVMCEQNGASQSVFGKLLKC